MVYKWDIYPCIESKTKIKIEFKLNSPKKTNKHVPYKNMFYIENDVKLGLLSLPSKSLEEKREVKERERERERERVYIYSKGLGEKGKGKP